MSAEMPAEFFVFSTLTMVVIVTGVVLIYFGYLRLRRNAMTHEERKLALKQGLPVPQEPVQPKNPVIRHKNAALQNRKAFVLLFFIFFSCFHTF